MTSTDTASFAERRTATIAGTLILLSALVTLGAIAHHPTVTRATSRADLFAQILRMRLADEIVHAVVLATALTLVYGLGVFALGRARRTSALAGFVAYSAGTAGAMGAALIDGFLTPAIAAHYVAAAPAEAAIAVQLLTLGALAIQVVTRFYLCTASVAIVIWSVELARSRGARRVLGGAGILIGVLAVALVLAFGALNPQSLGIILVVHTVWYVALGALMIRGEA